MPVSLLSLTIPTDDGCTLNTTEDKKYDSVVVLTNGHPPGLEGNLAGPYNPTDPTGSTIAISQEWQKFQIQVQRDLIKDIVAEIMAILARFNPSNVSGIEALITAVTETKDAIINLIKPGIWSIRQPWNWTFTSARQGFVIVMPEFFGTAWKNDDYFKWSVQMITRLNGSQGTDGLNSKPKTIGETEVHNDYPKIFAAPLRNGNNTISQNLKLNVYFKGYEEELKAALDALTAIGNWATRKLSKIQTDLEVLLRKLFGQPDKIKAAEDRHKKLEEKLDKEVRKKLERAKLRTTSAVERLRNHQSKVWLDKVTMNVLCLDMTREQVLKTVDEFNKKSDKCRAGDEKVISMTEKAEKESAKTALLESATELLKTTNRIEKTAEETGFRPTGSNDSKLAEFAVNAVDIAVADALDELSISDAVIDSEEMDSELETEIETKIEQLSSKQDRKKKKKKQKKK